MSATDSVIWAWCLKEVAPWRARKLELEQVRREFQRRNDAAPMLFLYRVRNGRVALAEKAPSTPDKVPIWRPPLYLRFLNEVVSRFCPDLETELLIHVGDGGVVQEPIPVFAFQKMMGANALLLPDVDALEFDFYYPRAQFSDNLSYEEKSCSAVFVGSTTGALITEQVARERSLPRLRAATFFKGNPKVDFRLPILTNLESKAVRALLMEMGFGGNDRLSYQEQFKHRFLISMDGFGATCSRVVVSLRSNSVLLKYNSAHQLHYFANLIPWQHYIPIENDSDVNEIIRIEEDAPGTFSAIARQGKEYAETYLTRLQVMKYTAWLLRAYAESFAGKTSGPGSPASLNPPPAFQTDVGTAGPRAAVPPPPSVEVTAHIAHFGDRRFPGGAWVGEQGEGAWIEGITLEPGFGVRPSEIEYHIVVHGGSVSRVFSGGQFCGSRARSIPILGFAARTAGALSRYWECEYSARFADGSQAGPARQGAVCKADNGAALQFLKVDIVARNDARQVAMESPNLRVSGIPDTSRGERSFGVVSTTLARSERE